MAFVVSLLPPKARIMKLNDEVLDRSEELVQIGFPLADAVHLAAAEYLGVDAFLTVDDRLLRRARRVVGRLAIRVVDPVIFLEEFSDANDR
jgi:predicted nucleic acid-binding protein